MWLFTVFSTLTLVVGDQEFGKSTEKSLNHQSNVFETKESHRDLIPDGKMKGILMFYSTVNKTDQCKTFKKSNLTHRSSMLAWKISRKGFRDADLCLLQF